MFQIANETNRESPAQFENRIMPWVYVRRVTHSTMYEKAPFYQPKLAIVKKIAMKHLGPVIVKYIILITPKALLTELMKFMFFFQ